MPEQHLDLLQLPTRRAAQLRGRATKIVSFRQACMKSPANNC